MKEKTVKISYYISATLSKAGIIIHRKDQKSIHIFPEELQKILNAWNEFSKDAAQPY